MSNGGKQVLYFYTVGVDVFETAGGSQDMRVLVAATSATEAIHAAARHEVVAAFLAVPRESVTIREAFILSVREMGEAAEILAGAVGGRLLPAT